MSEQPPQPRHDSLSFIVAPSGYILHVDMKQYNAPLPQVSSIESLTSLAESVQGIDLHLSESDSRAPTREMVERELELWKALGEVPERDRLDRCLARLKQALRDIATTYASHSDSNGAGATEFAVGLDAYLSDANKLD